MKWPSRLQIAIMCCIVLACLFAASVVFPGIPGFRHDWAWPSTGSDWGSFWTETISGWQSDAFGHSHPYPTQFFVITALTPIGLISPRLALAVLLGAIVALFGYANMRIARTMAVPQWFTVFVTMFLTFNPWTYNQVVAGHIMMILSIAALFALFAEVSSHDPQSGRIWILAILVAAQLQFAIIASAGALFCVRDRRAQIVAAALLTALLPSIIGIAFSWNSLKAIPYLTVWQQQQSIAPLDSIRLVGYSTHYESSLPSWFAVVEILYPLLAIGALWALRRRREAKYASVLICGIVLFAGGSRTWGPAYGWLVAHVVASGVYRELYDLVGLVTLIYAYLAMLGSCKASLRNAFAAVALAGLAAWLLGSPWHWWVALPTSSIEYSQVPSNSRYALFPYQQPLEWRGKGSGSDPDLHTDVARNISPLNGYITTYPAVLALGDYEKFGSTEQLSDLSVGRVFLRSDIRSDRGALAGQEPNPKENVNLESISASIPFSPEVAITGVPALTTSIPGLQSNKVFFADACRVCAFRPIAGSADTFDPTKAWVDARFVYNEYPNLAQPFGGVYTEQSHTGIKIWGRMILANINGRLVSNGGRLVAKSTRGYEWSPLPRRPTWVFCYGKCALVGIARREMLRTQATDRPSKKAPKATFRFWLPWLISVNVPRTCNASLRLNAAFDYWWLAMYHGHVLKHVRVDGIANSWRIPCRAEGTITILQVTALLQALGEVLSLGLIVLFGGRVIMRKVRGWPTQTS